MHHVSQLTALCGENALELAAVLFLAGLAGGFAHCGPMCGPFVLVQVAGTRPRALLARLAGAALLPFHLGRLATYTALGALAGAVGAAMFAVTGLRIAFTGLLTLAAALFILQAIRTMAPALFPPGRHPIGQGFAHLVVGRAARFLGHPEHARGFALGIVLGFLPCGFLYGALAAAAASGSAASGALVMAAFVLGTAPSLAAVGLVGHAMAARWTFVRARLLGPVFFINGVLLALMAARALSELL
jgi:hypothetical protein